MRKRFLVLLLVTALLLGMSTMAYAFGSYRTAFDNTYGTNSSYANNCGLCHQDGVPGATRIFYGFDFEAQPGHSNNPVGTTAAFRAIEGVDSDRDGFSNIDEINALTNPSDPNSKPAAAPTIGASPTSFTFTATVGGANPAAQTLTISNTGGGTLNWTVSDNATWLSLSPPSGTNSGTVTVSVDIAGLAAGTQNGTITITDAAATNNPVTVPVTLTLNAAPPPSPTIGASPPSFTFTATVGGANPAAQTLTISNTGGGTLNWTVSDNATWLSLSPTSGTNSGTVTVSVDIAGLTAGTQNATITVSDAAATNTPVTIPVTLTLNAAPPAETIPVPASDVQVFPYLTVADTVTTADPATMKPVGFGPYATGGDSLTVGINLLPFAGPVDLYGVAFHSVDQYVAALLMQGLASFQFLTLEEVDQILITGTVPPGVAPTFPNVTGATNASIPIDLTLPVQGGPSAIPPQPGLYTAYLAATAPIGTVNNAYLWVTNLNVGKLITITSTLSGSQMVPPVTTDGTGTATLTVDLATGQIIGADVSFSGLSGNAVAGHIHVGPPDQSLGPIILHLNCTAASRGTCDTSGGAPLQNPAVPGDEIEALLAGNLYYVVHSQSNPGGEIRGQIVFQDLTIASSLSGAQMVPPVSTQAAGTASLKVNLSTGAMSGTIDFANLSSPAVAAHIHIGSVGTPLGPVVVPYNCDSATTGTCRAPQGANLLNPNVQADEVVALLNNGLYYVVHSADHPTGEIRGQIQYPIFLLSAEMTGSQEVPVADTTATGLAQFEVNIQTREIKGTVTFSGLSGPAVAAHIHRGAFGIAGPIAVPLVGGTGLASGVYHVPPGTVLSAEDFELLRNDGLYVNVHTNANPPGEIRGQIVNIPMF